MPQRFGFFYYRHRGGSMTDYAAVLTALYPGAEWSLNGDSYEGLTWLSDSPKPSQAELDAAWPAVQYQNA
jgi:hypothetical protein